MRALLYIRHLESSGFMHDTLAFSILPFYDDGVGKAS